MIGRIVFWNETVNMAQSDHLANLRQWADWGRVYAPRRLSTADWSAVEVLIGAAEPTLLKDSKELRELLERSKEQLRFVRRAPQHFDQKGSVEENETGNRAPDERAGIYRSGMGTIRI
jgi:hypothetical protein